MVISVSGELLAAHDGIEITEQIDSRRALSKDALARRIVHDPRKKIEVAGQLIKRDRPGTTNFRDVVPKSKSPQRNHSSQAEPDQTHLPAVKGNSASRAPNTTNVEHIRYARRPRTKDE